MKIKWDERFVPLGLTAFVVVVCSIFFNWALTNWHGLYKVISMIVSALSPFILGLFIAVLLDKPVQIVEKYLFVPLFAKEESYTRQATKTTWVLSVALVQILTWAFLFGLLTLVMPQIYRSVIGIVSNVDKYTTTAATWAKNILSEYPELQVYVQQAIGSLTSGITTWIETALLPQISNVITGLTEGVFTLLSAALDLLIGIVLSIYLLLSRDTFIAQCKKILYGSFKANTANVIIDFFKEINTVFGGFFSGKIIDSIIIGILCYICTTLMKMPFSPLISLIIGVTNIIPVFGPFLGAIPSAIIILFESPFQCAIFLVFILALQQFDGNVLGPLVLGNTIGMSGFWIMIAILLFGDLFGFMGMLLGVPVLAVIYGIVQNLTNASLAKKGYPVLTTDYVKIKNIDPETNEPVYKEKINI